MEPIDPTGAKCTRASGAHQACVLLVEDDAIVAMLVEQMLLDMGLQVLVVATLRNALIEAEMADFDAAVIDMYLRGDRAEQLADVLLLGNIPFMVLSGGDQSAFRNACAACSSAELRRRRGQSATSATSRSNSDFRVAPCWRNQSRCSCHPGSRLLTCTQKRGEWLRTLR